MTDNLWNKYKLAREKYALLSKRIEHRAEKSHQEIIRLQLFNEICRENWRLIQETLREHTTQDIKSFLAHEKQLSASFQKCTMHFFNYISSAVARKELWVALMNRHFKGQDTEENKTRFHSEFHALMDMITTIEVLRNYIVHSTTPELFRVSESTGDTHKQGICIKKCQLQRFNKRSTENNHGKKDKVANYLNNAITGEYIYLSDLTVAYEESMQKFYAWGFPWIKEAHRRKHPDYHEILTALNEIKAVDTN